MALYAIGDLHLSQSVKKHMDIFSGWENHPDRLIKNWIDTVCPDDVVVLCGDTSWGMTLEEAMADFSLIDSLPGRMKLILKGNHDYWWCSASKMLGFFEACGFTTLRIMHNNAFCAESFRICGSRGWIFENGQPHDEKIINREAIRIEASLKASENMLGERVLFLHYPPVYAGQELKAYLDLMHRYGIKRCYYGHIHGAGHRSAIRGLYDGIEFGLISADYLGFMPRLI